MPKRKDLKKILVVGAGPIIIGQACEFDYSGTQACKALRDEGYKVVLINSNPATIMTDPDVADKTYIEPITLEVLEKILKKEKPDAILPTMGGQTALNLAMEAEKKGILKRYKIELIGANSKAISNAEDRKKFRKNMIDINLDLPKSEIVNNINQASKVLKKIGLPAIIRPAFTLGGLGGGIAKNKKDYFKIVKNVFKHRFIKNSLSAIIKNAVVDHTLNILFTKVKIFLNHKHFFKTLLLIDRCIYEKRTTIFFEIKIDLKSICDFKSLRKSFLNFCF